MGRQGTKEELLHWIECRKAGARREIEELRKNPPSSAQSWRRAVGFMNTMRPFVIEDPAEEEAENLAFHLAWSRLRRAAM